MSKCPIVSSLSGGKTNQCHLFCPLYLRAIADNQIPITEDLGLEFGQQLSFYVRNSFRFTIRFYVTVKGLG